jgi:hypothetical protein
MHSSASFVPRIIARLAAAERQPGRAAAAGIRPGRTDLQAGSPGNHVIFSKTPKIYHLSLTEKKCVVVLFSGRISVSRRSVTAADDRCTRRRANLPGAEHPADDFAISETRPQAARW